MMHRSPDRGSVTAFVVAITLAVLACAGLAVDGGRIVAAKLTAADHAENAARAGAQELTSLLDGGWHLDQERATAAAHAYLRNHGIDGAVVVSTRRVTVTVTLTVTTTLLGLVGVSAKMVRATRSSDPIRREI
jgi:Flp pilus assembly protein TadG